MDDKDGFNSFCEDLLQEVLAGAGDAEDGGFKVDQFTRMVSDYLIEAGEIEDVNVCFYKSRGMQLNGYNVNQDEDCLDIFVSVLNQQTPPVTVTKAQCEAAFRQAETCLRKGLTGFHSTLEESSESYDAFQRIHELKDSLVSCRIFLLTDGIVNQDAFHPEEGGDISVTLHVWDAARLYRLASSGRNTSRLKSTSLKNLARTSPVFRWLIPNQITKAISPSSPEKYLPESTKSMDHVCWSETSDRSSRPGATSIKGSGKLFLRSLIASLPTITVFRQPLMISNSMSRMAIQFRRSATCRS